MQEKNARESCNLGDKIRLETKSVNIGFYLNEVLDIRLEAPGCRSLVAGCWFLVSGHRLVMADIN